MLWLKQKNLSRMKYIALKFGGGVDLDINPLAGIFATAKACNLFPKHQRFVVCDIDLSRVEQVLSDVFEAFPKQFSF